MEYQLFQSLMESSCTHRSRIPNMILKIVIGTSGRNTDSLHKPKYAPGKLVHPRLGTAKKANFGNFCSSYYSEVWTITKCLSKLLSASRNQVVVSQQYSNLGWNEPLCNAAIQTIAAHPTKERKNNLGANIKTWTDGWSPRKISIYPNKTLVNGNH